MFYYDNRITRLQYTHNTPVPNDNVIPHQLMEFEEYEYAQNMSRQTT